MKVTKVILVVILVFLWTNFAFAGGVKIGYVDMQKVLLESLAGKDARNVLSQKSEQSKGVLKDLEENIKKLNEDIEKQKSVLSESAKKEKEEEVKDKKAEYLKTFKSLESELQTKDAELTNKIVKDVSGVVKKIGEKEGFTIIIQSSESSFTEGSILYAQEGLNITQKVIEEFDKTKGKVDEKQ